MESFGSRIYNDEACDRSVKSDEILSASSSFGPIVLRNVLENLKSILVFGGVEWTAILGVKRAFERRIPEETPR